MNTLTALLSSRVKSEILRLLFGSESGEFHLREIARRAALNDATIRQEMKRLDRLGLVRLRRDGNRAYFSANRTHPLYPELHGLVLKTSGLADVVRDALGHEGVRVSFVFGSIAGGTERPDSDVDLMVLGTASLRQLSARLLGVSDRLGRVVNSYAMTPEEFAFRLQSGDHFLTSVMAAPKLFLIGNEDELAGLGRQQVAAPSSEHPERNRRPAVHRRSRSPRRH